MLTRRLLKQNVNWSPKIAYAVGLIVTDGNLSKDRRHISLTSCDTDLLENFRKCLNLKANLTKNPSSRINQKQSYRVQFSNVRLYDWLMEIGLCPNKTFTINSISIPDKFFADFVRGHLDGDGSIIYYVDKYNTKKNPKYVYERLMIYLMSASHKHIIWLQTRIKELTKLHGAIQTKRYPARAKPSYVLKFSKKESVLLLRWIYYSPGLPYLKRKFEIAKKFLKD